MISFISKNNMDRTKSSRKGKGIFFRTFSLLLLLSLIIITLFTIMITLRQKKTILKSIEAQAKSLSASMAQVFGNAIASEDYGFIIDHNLEVIKNSPDILYVFVVRYDGFSLVHRAGKWEQRLKPDQEWGGKPGEKENGHIVFDKQFQKDVFHYSYPLQYSGIDWGWLHLGLSLDQFNKELKSMYKRIIFLSLLCLSVGILGAYIFASRLTGPIILLRRATEKIAQGDLSARAEILTGDEIGDLALSFNEMTEVLQRTTVSRNYLDNIFKNMINTLIVLTPDGIIQTVNQAACDLLGYQEKELIGQLASMIFAEKGFIKKTGFDILVNKGFVSNVETAYISKDGKKIPVLFSGSVMPDKEGKAQGIVYVAQDITARKEAEEEAKRMQVKMIAASKLATLGEMATGAAHEINQPLTYISGCIQNLKRDLKRNAIDKTTLEEDLKNASEQVARIVSIIDHLRTFGRQYDMQMEDIDLKKALDNSLLLLGERIRLRNIKLIRHIEENLPMVWGNVNQMEQVFINLFQNAIYAFGNKTKNAEITVDITIPDNREAVQMKFSDNGPGIEESILDKIFEPFFTTKEVGKGTGLGLSIVYGIIREHKGSITCESQLNKGTTFTIAMPCEKMKSRELK